MIRLNILAEGQTEEIFVRRVLAPHLGHHGIWAVARRVETSRVRTTYTPRGARAGRIHRGGLRRYARARDDLRRWMKEDQSPEAHFTTMFDLYGLPRDFPGYRPAQNEQDPYQKVALLENALRDDIDHPRFLPYLQLHEFESLVLAAPVKLDWAFIDHDAAIRRLQRLCEEYETPELIDDGLETAPSKRIIREIPECDDDKANTGPLVVEKIGIELLRTRCPHFTAWVERLETLAQVQAPG